jgi:superfamily II DNA or RNA helicase
MTVQLLKPRDYQTECIRAIHTKWDAGVTRPASVLPTGAGKTVVFAHLAEEYLKANPGKRVLVLSHTDELVLQAAHKMRQVAPHRTVGIVKAERNEVHAQVISASVQSLRSPGRRDKLKSVGLIIVDECHHAVAATYLAILRHFGALAPVEYTPDWEPTCLTAGFTATLVRGDKEKLSDVWQDVAYRKDIAFMIRRGYLLDVRGRRVIVPDFDLRTVRMSGGDFREGSLGEALVDALAPEVVAKAYVEHAGQRKGLLFAPTVDSAYAFADAFNLEGIKAEVVHGALGRDERRAILARFRDGTTQVVCNCMVLTEGFDEPTADVVVVARPTTNAGLYQQMIGRVLRPDLTIPAGERQPALILDVVGVSRKHGLQSLVDLTSREDLADKDLDEDLTLLELEELELVEPAEGAPAHGDEYYAGPVDTEDFDPLARASERTWGRTPDGIYYVPAGGHQYVFLVDSLKGDPGTYDVVWCTKEPGGPGTAGLTEHQGLSFEMALSWGEEESLERGGLGAKTLSTKKAKWRKDPATSGQLWKAKREAGVSFKLNDENQAVHPDGRLVTKGDVSEIIEGSAAARRIDPLVQAVMGARKK